MLYGALFVATFVAALLIPAWLRPEGRAPRIADPDQLAYLAGGRRALRGYGGVAAARVGRAGDLVERPLPDRAARRGAPPPRSAACWRCRRPRAGPRWARAIKPHADPVERQLVASGLLMESGTAWQLRFWQTLPYLLLFAFGAIKWDVGMARDRPVGFLTLFLVATAIFALVRFLALDRRTRGGREALAAARAGADRLRRAPTAPETDTAVALFGTAVLAGSGYAAFDAMRRSSGSDSGGGGGSDGGGGGGGAADAADAAAATERQRLRGGSAGDSIARNDGAAPAGAGRPRAHAAWPRAVAGGGRAALCGGHRAVLAIPALALASELALGPAGVLGYMAGLTLTAVIGLGAALTVQSARRAR